MPGMSRFTAEQIAAAKVYAASTPPDDLDPRIEALVNDLIGRVADKWTMLILEVLAERGELRFTRLGALVEGISQKMLTQTLRGLERDGLVTRTVTPIIPPRVDYELTELGISLRAPVKALGDWAIEHIGCIRTAQQRFDAAADAPD